MNPNGTKETSTDEPDLTRDQLELEKLRLENNKLRLEITEWARPWWKKPTHSLYTLIALCSMSIAFLTQSFQANSARLDTEKAILAQDNKDFDLKRDPVHKELDQTKSQLNDKSQQLVEINQQLASTKVELATVKQQVDLDKLRQSVRSTEKSLSTLATSNARLSQSLYTTLTDKQIAKIINSPLKPRPPLLPSGIPKLSTVKPGKRPLIESIKLPSAYLAPKQPVFSNPLKSPPKETWFEYIKRQLK